MPASATQPQSEKRSPSIAPTIIGTIAETTAPSGDRIEIGPIASEAYRQVMANAEAIGHVAGVNP